MSVAVFTSTRGRPTLPQTIESVRRQTMPCQHYIVFNGCSPQEEMPDEAHILCLPNDTGANGIMNGAVCAMAAFIATEDYICFCDDDNWFEPNHVETLVRALREKNAGYAYCLRNLVHPNGEFYARDDGESLGHYGDLVDVNCYLLRRDLAAGIAPLWARTDGQTMIGDRYVWAALRQANTPWASTGRYTLNYRMSARGVDMKPFFFLRNIQAKARFPEGFPWSISSTPSMAG
jgi:glycosyltransferase involved in cell wall biosynthesis